MRRGHVLHSVEIVPRVVGCLLREVRQIGVELGEGEISVNPVIFQIRRTPERTSWRWRWRLVGLPYAEESLGKQFLESFVKRTLVLRNEILPELLHKPLIEVRRIIPLKLRSDLEDDELRGGLTEELLHVVQHFVYHVARENAMADFPILLDTDIENASSDHQLLVDQEFLTPRERPADERDADPIGR